MKARGSWTPAMTVVWLFSGVGFWPFWPPLGLVGHRCPFAACRSWKITSIVEAGAMRDDYAHIVAIPRYLILLLPVSDQA